MARTSAVNEARKRRREYTHDSERYVEMRLDVVRQDFSETEVPGWTRTENGEWWSEGSRVVSAGGRWDRRKKRYVGRGSKCVRRALHDRQVEAIDWYQTWLARHIDPEPVPDDEAIYSMILHGGQRGGKTFVGVSAIPILYALARPGFFVWIVCPTSDDFEEVEIELEKTLHRSWYKKRVRKTLIHYHLANGSRIVLRSAHNAVSLKKGRCDLIVMNECQQMSNEAFVVCRGRISDKGGLVVGCANPPRKPIGEWVADWVLGAQNKTRKAIEFYFSPFDNPHIKHAALRALADEVDKRTYDIEVLGMMLSIGKTVLHNWDRRQNEVTLELLAKRAGVKRLRDITRKVTERLEGFAVSQVLSTDVQLDPMVSTAWRFYENPLARVRDRGDDWWRWCYAFAFDEVYLENADEEDLARTWLEKGWEPDETLIVCDASARWQFSYRDAKKVAELRDKVKGQGSWDVFRYVGYKNIVPPDRDMAKNPDIVERCRATTARIRTKHQGKFGERYLFSAPSNRHANLAARRWPTDPRGRPSRTSKYAHMGDTVTYFGQRFFQRRWNHDPVEEDFDIPDGRFEGERRTRGYT